MAKKLAPAPRWAVPVRGVSFFALVASGAASPRAAWRLRRGALVSPFVQSCVLCQVRAWRFAWRLRLQACGHVAVVAGQALAALAGLARP